MSLRVVLRKQQKRTVRTWVRCDECSTYGSFTVEDVTDADALFDLMQHNHKSHCSASMPS